MPRRFMPSIPCLVPVSSRSPLLLVVIAVVGLCFSTGCGGGAGGGSSANSTGNPSMGPHSGPLFKLPGDQGFIELIMEIEGKGTIVAAYALKSDMKTPLEKGNAPSDLRLKIQDQEDQSMHDIPFTLKPKPKGPAGEVRFASPPGGYGFSVFDGELCGTVNGQSFSEKIHRTGP